jgi:hypothetical protein
MWRAGMDLTILPIPALIEGEKIMTGVYVDFFWVPAAFALGIVIAALVDWYLNRGVRW